MKIEFWKNPYGVLFYWPLMSVISLSGLVSSIVLTIKDNSFWPIILASIIMISLCIYAIFFQKSTLMKVVFSSDGIELKRFGKTITNIDWLHITEIEPKYFGKYNCFILFKSNKEEIDFAPSKKIYKAITVLCPNPNIIAMINSIDVFKYLHKEKRNKNEN